MPPALPQEEQPIVAAAPEIRLPDSRTTKPESAPAAEVKKDATPNAGNEGRDGYPALIVFKAGGMYSATNYWVKKTLLYFATTQGQTLFVPLADVDRIYPAQPPRTR